MRLIQICIVLFLGISPLVVQAQKKAPDNWFNLDLKDDGVPGVSTEKTYNSLLKGKKGKPVIVAVLDGGVEPDHEDLKNVMWKNPKEKPANNKDDDGNGYIDDIYGWNFIGNANGENVNLDLLELTRLYVKYDKEFAGKSRESLSSRDKKRYDQYLKFGEDIRIEQEKTAANLNLYIAMKDNYLQSEEILKTHLGKDTITIEDIKGIQSTDEKITAAVTAVSRLMENGQDASFFENVINFFKGRQAYYDTTFDPRYIVGDNYSNSYEWNYGNPDIVGPEAFHGTHVAGIIGADRKNDIGIKGVCVNALIMGVRVVPDGDERDKDVANGIRYAVDNGAKIINMSFGKPYSWDKQVVDDAVRYAEAHDVLLVHAAGNDAKNTDENDNFPNRNFEKSGLFKSKKAKNWIEVGASNFQDNERLAAPFSNYGKNHVDLFAPGMAIYSTTPGSSYGDAQGTSMAAPVVAGVAAMIRSYYPDLTASQVRDIMMKSVTKVDRKIIKPGTKDEMVLFSDLCVSGGIVNAYEAMRLAAITKPAKKPKAPRIKTTDRSFNGKGSKAKV